MARKSTPRARLIRSEYQQWLRDNPSAAKKKKLRVAAFDRIADKYADKVLV